MLLDVGSSSGADDEDGAPSSEAEAFRGKVLMIGEGSGVSTSTTGVRCSDDDGGGTSINGKPPNLKVLNRCRWSTSDVKDLFIDSHCFLIKSAADGSLSLDEDSSDGGRTTGMCRSCSCSCWLRSLLGLSGGKSPRSRKAASRALFAAADKVGVGMAGLGMGGAGEEERDRNLDVIMLMIDFERGLGVLILTSR